MTSESSAHPISKKFVSQTELDEKRQKRQEEWDKVRRPDQPLEAPEEVYDPRSLYQQLQDEKTKKQDEHDEQFKLKNQVKGLEDDEAEFLDFVSDRQQQLLNERHQEEQHVLEEYRNALTVKAEEQNKAQTKSNKPIKPQQKQSKKSQLQLLAGAVKRKSTDQDEALMKKSKSKEENGMKLSVETKSDQTTDVQPCVQQSYDSINKTGTIKDNNTVIGGDSCDKSDSISQDTTQGPKMSGSTPSQQVAGAVPTLQVVGVLPGLGVYSDSDSSSDSSSSVSSSPVRQCVNSLTHNHHHHH